MLCPTWPLPMNPMVVMVGLLLVLVRFSVWVSGFESELAVGVAAHQGRDCRRRVVHGKGRPDGNPQLAVGCHLEHPGALRGPVRSAFRIGSPDPLQAVGLCPSG